MNNTPPVTGTAAETGGAEEQAMAGIRALDPSFTRFEELQTMPESARFNELVQKGNTLTDAFRLARFDVLAGRRAAEAGKAALMNAYNRSHLSATAVNGTQTASVPAETLEMYRLLQPGLRDEDYRAHYLRHNAKQ